MFHSRTMYDEVLTFEIRSVLSDAAAEKRIPTIQEITRTTIPYIDSVMEEIICHSLTKAGIVRTAVVDIEVLSHHIPKDTDIFLMGNGPNIFSPAFQIEDLLRSPSALVAKT